MQVDLTFGARKFAVDVSFSTRKRLSVTVHPDLRVTAKAPAGYEPEVLRQRLKKRSSWIARQVDYFEQFQPLPTERKFISGETHYYLGRQYRLRIRTGETDRVRLIGRFFEMELLETSNREKAQTKILEWYTIHPKDLL